MGKCHGFTLIEVLVALAIVAIGMAAVIGAVGSSADTAAYLRDKTFANWIALNQLEQARLGNRMPAKGTTEGELDYAGHHWRWQQDVNDFAFPGMIRIDVKVQQADTAKGKDAPWIGSVTGAMGDALAPQALVSVYNEYLPPGTPGPGGINGTTPQPGTTPNGLNPQNGVNPQNGLAPGSSGPGSTGTGVPIGPGLSNGTQLPPGAP